MDIIVLMAVTSLRALQLRCCEVAASAEHLNTARELRRCRQRETERRRWRQIEEKHEEYPRNLTGHTGRASRLPSFVWKRREAAELTTGWRRRKSFFVGWWKVRTVDFITDLL